LHSFFPCGITEKMEKVSVAQCIEEITRLDNEIGRLQRIRWSYDRDSPQMKLWRREKRIQDQVAVEFGRSRGWKLSRKMFSLEQLRTGRPMRGSKDYAGISPRFDHPYWYRAGRVPVAIACHLYDWDGWHEEEFAAECKRHGLQYSVVTDFPSWWLPGWSQLVVVTAMRRASESRAGPRRLGQTAPQQPFS
jgi:hypothetical protein